jgi:hypothetical protein
VFNNSGHRPDRKISTMAGVSPIPKNSMAIGISEIGGTERKVCKVELPIPDVAM